MRSDSPRPCPTHTHTHTLYPCVPFLRTVFLRLHTHRRATIHEPWRKRVYLFLCDARKAQKGHNGPHSQIGVYNEVSREGSGVGEGGSGVVVSLIRLCDREGARQRWRGVVSPSSRTHLPHYAAPGHSPRPLILAKRQPFCT